MKKIAVVVTDRWMMKVCKQLLDWMASHNPGSDRARTQEPELAEGGAHASIKDWGDWEVSRDLSNDWGGDYSGAPTEPTSQTRAAAEKIQANFNNIYPALRIYITSSEKNWYELQVSPR